MQVQLSNNDRTRLFQSIHHRRILSRKEIREDLRSTGSTDSLGEDNVFEPDGNSVKGPGVASPDN